MNVNAAAAAKEKNTRIMEHIKNAFKGTLISMIFTVAVMLLFALIIKETGMADAVDMGLKR